MKGSQPQEPVSLRLRILRQLPKRGFVQSLEMLGIPIRLGAVPPAMPYREYRAESTVERAMLPRRQSVNTMTWTVASRYHHGTDTADTPAVAVIGANGQSRIQGSASLAQEREDAELGGIATDIAR